MLISEKTTASILFFFASKEAYPIVRQLEKITVKKVQAKVVKCTKNKSWVFRTPLGYLSVNHMCCSAVLIFSNIWPTCNLVHTLLCLNVPF